MNKELMEIWSKHLKLPRMKKGSIIIIGGVDTGKSSLVEYICGLMPGKKLFGLISADLGQSLFGLPTCFSYSSYTGENIRELEPEKTIFVGSSSPRGNFLKVIVAFHKLLKYSNKFHSITIIDTDGMVQDNAGKEYKGALIEMIDTGIIVALQKEDELEHIIKGVLEQSTIPFLLMNVPAEIKEKSVKERSVYRQNKFLHYFRNKVEKVYTIDPARILGMAFGVGKVMDNATLDVVSKLMRQKALYGEYGKYEFAVILEKPVEREDVLRTSQEVSIRKLITYPITDFQNLLVGFNDDEGFTQLVAVIKEISPDLSELKLHVPYDEDLSAYTCVLGKEHIFFDQ
ncbi:MAG: hypothetical protein A2Y62_02980 [Candidatus Fischerbacteria bacterium RBG_13_37_8]|uniref:Clp1 P-loop domain-containing protein n=1 Tax=Candidatus Fischerbacteria bacterium RBG_13_37_8 TaxID=1817863 RepID=A0A1F5VDY8_9BACT|nr:MAG: hypothetical protein A2Y62_02980 [Candidatus Fischerbacteria bacterium RBG_13_37_8]